MTQDHRADLPLEQGATDDDARPLNESPETTSPPAERDPTLQSAAPRDVEPASEAEGPEPASEVGEPGPSPEAGKPTPDVMKPAAGDDEDDGDSAEFARLLEQQEAAPTRVFRPGDKVTGTIVQIGEQDAYVDCGGRNELRLDVGELRGEDGQIAHAVGDEITAHVKKDSEGELGLTRALALDTAGLEALQQASESGTPVKGKVQDVNKGGLTVQVAGRRGFCPFSQIDLRRVEDPERFIGQELEFKILELSEDGRNIVLSRRALLQERRETEATETRSTLALGDERTGRVTRLVPFGAFVDIGGVEGLVHISQISHERVSDPAEVLEEGQEVRVKVLEIQNLGQGRRERVGLSMKALAADPWPATAERLQPGTDVRGVVTRLVDFGVFVELEPGVEGLVHISEMADRRILHPRELVSEGDEVDVRVLTVDLERRRISLSLRQTAGYDL
ncbi:MAG: S1 RNA-binding domain-containing protein [Candidatus Krumholzibacteriia bacterium]